MSYLVSGGIDLGHQPQRVHQRARNFRKDALAAIDVITWSLSRGQCARVRGDLMETLMPHYIRVVI
jgi:hypothetical protein